MSRSGYNDDGDYTEWSQICWRGAVASSIKGKRGQAFLRELVEALDAMPEKRLIANDLRRGDQVCALGSVGAARGIDLEALDPGDHVELSNVFGIAKAMLREIVDLNDGGCAFKNTSPEDRWHDMRRWAIENLKEK